MLAAARLTEGASAAGSGTTGNPIVLNTIAAIVENLLQDTPPSTVPSDTLYETPTEGGPTTVGLNTETETIGALTTTI